MMAGAIYSRDERGTDVDTLAQSGAHRLSELSRRPMSVSTGSPTAQVPASADPARDGTTQDTPSSLDACLPCEGRSILHSGSASPANSTPRLSAVHCRRQDDRRMPASVRSCSPFTYSPTEVHQSNSLLSSLRNCSADFLTGNKPEGSFEPTGVLSAWPLPLSRGSCLGELA